MGLIRFHLRVSSSHCLGWFTLIAPTSLHLADTIRFLANYADDYSIPTLMAKCEKHLQYCHEIPLFERLRIAFDFGMKDAQVGYITSLPIFTVFTRPPRLELPDGHGDQ
jgi:hypothetical protein